MPYFRALKILSIKWYNTKNIFKKLKKKKHSQNNAGRDTQALPRIFRFFEYPPPPTHKKKYISL